MGILRSVALGKSRKSAGELTFYQRIGVPCFRQKPARSPGYKSSVPQRMQQSVFRFMKANMDAANLKSFVDLFYDAKPRKNKSETKMNMFYRAFMPHLVNEKPAIYALPADDLVNPSLFLGTPATNNDKLTNGQLGDLVVLAGSVSSFTMSQVALDQIIDKANTLISTKEVPFTIDNIFVGIVGADPTSPTKYKTVGATAVLPTLADEVYTFDITDVASGIDIAQTAYVALLIAGKDDAGDIDITRRKFATDSAKLQGNVAPAAPLTIVSAAKIDNTHFSITVPTQEFTNAKISLPADGSLSLRHSDGTTKYGYRGDAVESGSNTVITLQIIGSNTISAVTINNTEESQLWTEPEIGNDTKLCTMTNAVTVALA